MKQFLKTQVNEADWFFCIHVLIDTPTYVQKAGPEVFLGKLILWTLINYGSFAGSFLAGCVHPVL